MYNHLTHKCVLQSTHQYEAKLRKQFKKCVQPKNKYSINTDHVRTIY